MPIQTKFVRDGRVMINTYTEPLEMTEVDAMVDRVNREVLDKAVAIIHTISDVTQIRELPPRMLSGARAVNRKRHRMAGYSYIVVKPGLISAMTRSLLAVLGSKQLQISYSVDDALGKIDQALSQESSNREVKS